MFIIKNMLKMDFGVKPHPSIILATSMVIRFWTSNNMSSIFIQKRVNNMFEKKKKGLGTPNHSSRHI